MTIDGSLIRIPDVASLRLTKGTLCIYGDFTTWDGTLLHKGDNYKVDLYESGGVYRIYLRSNNGGATERYANVASYYGAGTIYQIAVAFRHGKKARFYVNGSFVGEGNDVNNVDDTDESDLIIGNTSDETDPAHCYIRQVYVGDEVLTDREILALYEQAQVINGDIMETGNRVSERWPTSSTTDEAIDHEFDPGGPFQLIDVKMVLSAAATESENMVIDWTNGTDTCEEYSEDLSETALTENVWRFDKRYSDGSKINVSFPNTDELDIYLVVTYQLDESVV